MNQIRAAIHFLKSFRKSDWALGDYPVRELHRPTSEPTGRRRAYPCTAQIINWWHMRGDGFTPEEALRALEERFAVFKRDNPLPRPGRGAPLKWQFASTTTVDDHRDLVRDLLERVVGIDPDQCLVTDESSLWDFHDGDTNEPYVRRIALLYGVDVSTVEPPTLASICQRIKEHQGA